MKRIGSVLWCVSFKYELPSDGRDHLYSTIHVTTLPGHGDIREAIEAAIKYLNRASEWSVARRMVNCEIRKVELIGTIDA